MKKGKKKRRKKKEELRADGETNKGKERIVTETKQNHVKSEEGGSHNESSRHCMAVKVHSDKKEKKRRENVKLTNNQTN